ncbi:methanobactin biosynthesis protein MbnC [Methylocystis parvus]|uniref:Methanobactin biosynthesis cassette protein MbnC n=1 Tax=Methylocystis parvus TaxID=134 RepID=A0A6B8M9Z0_9HYPH|nr:methanobactin biosynthesis protein MbnC [Methylocystis parvus]QGM98419.1 methanobactin biosynthesis cassette protein MbnC [Methylocystis parvus]WBK01248.1 methanobactin biosynthesis cassette protein MbnC [Methylocystis parvus OBBP]
MSQTSLARTDPELYDVLTSPKLILNYPPESRAYARIDVSLRAYWHSTFDICPELLELSGPDGMSIFSPFMEWARERGVRFTWSYYLWLYVWLRQSAFADRLTKDLLQSLIGASAARWAVRDRSAAMGLVIGCKEVPNLVVGWKCRSLDAGRQVEMIELEEPLPLGDEFFGYFTVAAPEITTFPGWRSLPL